MRRSLPMTFAFIALPFAAAAAEPTFYEKPIASLADCHTAMEDQLPMWRERSDVKVRELPGGRQVIDFCVSFGISELYCDPKARRSVFAVLEGETLPICKDETPDLPVRALDMLIDG